jgi:hypothetical protein
LHVREYLLAGANLTKDNAKAPNIDFVRIDRVSLPVVLAVWQAFRRFVGPTSTDTYNKQQANEIAGEKVRMQGIQEIVW